MLHDMMTMDHTMPHDMHHTEGTDSCYLRSSFQDQCPSGYELFGDLCFEAADPEHRCIGDQCYKNCPAGYSDSLSDLLDPYNIL